MAGVAHNMNSGLTLLLPSEAREEEAFMGIFTLNEIGQKTAALGVKQVLQADVFHISLCAALPMLQPSLFLWHIPKRRFKY